MYSPIIGMHEDVAINFNGKRASLRLQLARDMETRELAILYSIYYAGGELAYEVYSLCSLYEDKAMEKIRHLAEKVRKGRYAILDKNRKIRLEIN